MTKAFKLTFFALLLGLLSSCNDSNKNGNEHFSLNDIEDLKTRQYAIEGQLLYENYCANCHQKDGTGLGKLIPPLVAADFLLHDEDRTVKIIRHGLKGGITVNGVQYNQPMPGNPKLTNLEIAEIATYVYCVFGRDERLIDAKKVKQYLEE
ncbi:cytochrome c [Echinicola sp. CAU 1574]|uniref:Cytochrome c n=1 Tax=Echinicola arenosa TaxID=2774144 RepID=A0ABR9AQX7_9BACT|nr:cytochrome c [Echinicola arenosa]MBD8491191.1 cytochrome c [Echinicola arenosa]